MAEGSNFQMTTSDGSVVEIKYDVVLAQRDILDGLSEQANTVFTGLNGMLAELQANWDIAGTNPLLSSANGTGFEELITGVNTIKQNFDSVSEFCDFAVSTFKNVEEENTSTIGQAKALLPQ